MAALTERFHGLRRPGASLLKKGLPSRPDEPVITRKAVPPPKVTVEPAAPPASNKSSSSLPSPPVPEHKTLPSLPPPVSPPPASSLPPTPSASSPASAATITPFTASSQSSLPSQSSQPANQSSRPPRTSSLNDPQPAGPQPPAYSDKRPQHRLVANLQVNNDIRQKRPVSEAPSISQFIPDPEPEPEFDPETEAANRGGESENSSVQTPSSSIRNSDSNSNGSEPSTGVFKNYPDGYVPPIPETIVIPPMTAVHYGCFTSHAAMPAASNVWYATACMTCKRVDQEVRHRCTFCSMRICAPCFESLQKCKNRSLDELMAKLH